MSEEPDIYAVEELPESEQGKPCLFWTGVNPDQCGGDSEYVVVYEASTDPDNDDRRNIICCSGCKPRSVDTATDRADYTPESDGDADE